MLKVHVGQKMLAVSSNKSDRSKAWTFCSYTPQLQRNISAFKPRKEKKNT